MRFILYYFLFFVFTHLIECHSILSDMRGRRGVELPLVGRAATVRAEFDTWKDDVQVPPRCCHRIIVSVKNRGSFERNIIEEVKTLVGARDSSSYSPPRGVEWLTIS